MIQLLEQLIEPIRSMGAQHELRCAARGITIAFTSGWRSPATQLALYAKGRRLVVGSWIVTDPSAVVTHALPAQAPHCRAAAYDVVPIVAEKAAWDRLDLFAIVGEEGKRLGLVWGGDWLKLKDLCHFELANWRELAPVDSIGPRPLKRTGLPDY